MSQSTKSTKIEIRLTEAEKLEWKMQADEEGVTLSGLIRRRLRRTGPLAPAQYREATDAELTTRDKAGDYAGVRKPVDLNAHELRPLLGWLDLADVDGEIDEDQLADWRAFAEASPQPPISTLFDKLEAGV